MLSDVSYARSSVSVISAVGSLTPEKNTFTDKSNSTAKLVISELSRKNRLVSNFNDNGAGSVVETGENVDLRGSIEGKNNQIKIADTTLPSVFRIIIRGDNNNIQIGENTRCRGLDIRVGNHVPANKAAVKIGSNFTSENECKFLLYNHGNKLEIGDDCMFSNSIILRCGESPHLIFSNSTGEYLDVSDGVYIGDHVWVGERSYLTKRSSIASGCIVAACSTVSKVFEEKNTVIAGNPAKVVRNDIKWVRNRSKLDADSIEFENLQKIKNKYI